MNMGGEPPEGTSSSCNRNSGARGPPAAVSLSHPVLSLPAPRDCGPQAPLPWGSAGMTTGLG